MWDLIVNHFSEYIGTGLIFIIYLACVIRMFIIEKRKEYRILFIYMPAVVLVLFLCPIVAKIMQKYADDEIYYRIMWLLPVAVTIAYTVVDLYGRVKEKLKAVVLILSALLIVAGGRLVYTDMEYSIAENEYHVPQTVVDICDETVVPGREIVVAFPADLLVYVRQYTPLIVMPYGYDELKYMKLRNPLYEQMIAEKPDAEKLFAEAVNMKCHYVVIEEAKEIIGDPEEYGFTEYKHIDGYVLYRNNQAYFGL